MFVLCVVVQAFFRRSLRNKLEYKCVSNEECVIEPGKRNTCSACRLKKCVDVGMSVTGLYLLLFISKLLQSLGMFVILTK